MENKQPVIPERNGASPAEAMRALTQYGYSLQHKHVGRQLLPARLRAFAAILAVGVPIGTLLHVDIG